MKYLNILLFTFLIGSGFFAYNLITEVKEFNETSQASLQEQTVLNRKLDKLMANLTAKPSTDYLPSRTGQVISYWKGGQQLDYGNLYQTISYVIDKAPFEIADKQGMISLLMETAATESFFGKEIVQRNNGAGRGVLQMEMRTVTCIQDNFLKYNKELIPFILQFKDKNLSLEDNIKFNLPYQISYALVFWYRKGVTEFDLSSSDIRATFYKRYWNTPLGKGTEQIYLENRELYLVGI